MPANLNALPPEIQLDILDHLDYSTLKQSECVNEHFQALVTNDRLKNALVIYELEVLAEENCEEMGLPYYSYSNIRPLRCFNGAYALRARKRRLGGFWVGARACLLCIADSC